MSLCKIFFILQEVKNSLFKMLLIYQSTKLDNRPPYHFQCLAELSGMPRDLSSPDIRDMKIRIKRQDVEHFRMGLSTEKIDCCIKFRKMKDTSLPFDVIFFICIGILKTETAFRGFSCKDCKLKGKSAHRLNSMALQILFVFFFSSYLVIYVIV